MNFRILFDNIQTISTIYNSKTTFLKANEFNSNFLRIDILDENIDEINDISNHILLGNRFNGNKYTNANLNRNI